MQTLGVRYYMVFSDQAKELADRSAQLTPVATTPDTDGQPPRGWTIYEVRDAPVVQALGERARRRPRRLEQGLAGRGRSAVVGRSTRTPPTPVTCAARPAARRRRAVELGACPPAWCLARRRARPEAAGRQDCAGRDPPTVEVSRVRTTDHSVSFRVSRTGVPVMVKTSYFPNWTATGAKGPWRATPNFMVVVPTSREVRLDYSTTTPEYLGRVGTAAGLGRRGGAGALAVVAASGGIAADRGRGERAAGGDAGYPAAE